MVFCFAKSTIKYGLKVFFLHYGIPIFRQHKKYQVQSNKKTPYEMIKLKRKTIEGPKK